VPANGQWQLFSDMVERQTCDVVEPGMKKLSTYTYDSAIALYLVIEGTKHIDDSVLRRPIRHVNWPGS